MTIAVWILSLLTAAELGFAPVNLWTGRTRPNFTRFTGLPSRLAFTLFGAAAAALLLLRVLA